MHVCVFIYIQNNYAQCTHIYYVNKLLFWIRLIAINRLTAQIKIEISYFKLQKYFTILLYFTVLFDQINAALVSRRDFFQKH